jgi:hypothetical protein
MAGLKENGRNSMVVVAAVGLLGLFIGAALVNAVSTPRAAQIGTALAGIGIMLLAILAVWVLLA